MSNVYQTLLDRGFVQSASDAEGLEQAMKGCVTAYCGYDPTASSLHAGSLLSIMALRHMQQAGHRVIIIVGGGTGLIGDPSGKSSQRPMLKPEDIQHNLESQLSQFCRFLDFSDGKALILNNADWLLPLRYVSFLRDIGRHFSVNQLLQHETYRERLNGEGLSFVEFNYALLQAYDFLHLYREYGCTLQIGGADQWFNILLGVDLIRRVESGAAYGLVSPLLTTSSGRKMGKTESGAIWLDPVRTSPYDYYQFWVNTEDGDVERFLKLYTVLPLEELRRLGELRGADRRAAKEVLAYEATQLCHGREAADQARAAAWALFGDGDGEGAAMPSVNIDASELNAGLPASQIFVVAGLCRTRSEAKRLIEQGGAYLNGCRLQGDEVIDGERLVEGMLLLRAGKKRYLRLRVSR